MKLRLLILLTTALCGLCTAAAQPAPEKTTPREGIFTFGPGTTISADRELAPLAEYAAEYLGCGVRNGMAGEGSVVLTLDAPDGEPSEAYTLDITPDHIQIGSSTCGGVFNGLQQLFRLLPPEVYARRGIAPGTGIACVRIEDKPRFGYRGMMLDVARTWIGMDEVKRYIDLFSYHNINKLHLHLSDDEGWRIEILSHPELTEIGGFRGGDSPVRPVYGKWSEKYGGYFKQSEMRELIRYAALRNIEIIPEIDVPAHSLAFSHYKPELGSKEYGMDHLNLSHPEVYSFVDALFKEYLDGENPVFRGPKVHIGTDEYSNKKKDVVEKFREFTDHYIRFVEGFGKQACVWGALTHAKGETPVKSKNVLMSAWYNGYADPKEMIKQGYDLVSVPDGYLYIVPAAGYYYDYLNTEMLYKEWTPAHIGKEVFPEKHKQIKGGMFAVWNDHAGNGISTKDIHYRVFPALQTLAVKMWTGKDCKVPYETFNTQRLELSEGPGVNVAGRMGNKPRAIYNQDVLPPNTKTGLKEIGYHYTVSFDVQSVKETPGTELFRSPDAVFYLSDPVSGKLGFARDGYLNTFNYQFYPEEETSVAISGDEKSTRLYINGKLQEELNIQKRFFNGGKDSMSYVRTLVFPLEKTGDFKSTVKNELLQVTLS